MMRITIFTTVVCLLLSSLAAADVWNDLKKYQYGDDLAPLLFIERQVEASMADKEQQKAMAARLLDILIDKDATPAARQHAGLMLRICGTEAEVPALTKLLGQGKPGEFARGALERIPAEAAGKALRDSLTRLKGPALIAAINSLANRLDSEAVAALIGLTGDKDDEVAAAAAHSLGRIGGPKASAHLKQLAADGKNAELAQAYLSCGIVTRDNADKTTAAEIFTELANAKYPAPVRRAALKGQLGLSSDPASRVTAWLEGDNADARTVAMNNINKLSNAQLLKLAQGKTTEKAIPFAVELAGRCDKAALPLLSEAVKQKNNQTIRKLAILAMPKIADRDSVELLIEILAEKSPAAQAAVATLSVMPAELVDGPIVEAFEKTSGWQRATVNDVVVARRITDIVPLLLKMAGVENDPALRSDVVWALRALGDEKALPPLVEIILGSKDRKHRDALETTYLEIAKRHGKTTQPILDAMRDNRTSVALLPVLGRVGGPEALKKVEAAVAAKDDELRTAGVRAMCNWPDASVAEQLAKLARDEKDRGVRVRALRAYIRVVSLKSKRPAAETLAMLKKSFAMAQRPEEKILVTQRAAAVRDVATLDWLVALLDDEVTAQASCRSIVELSHHRYLRNPNREKFNAALKKVIAICKNPKTVSRAKGYLQGV